ncbi:MAG: hypothetical protein D8H98_03095 [Prevotella sp.]|nr:MAG: hypothetical protein D8H98_03095 [Prevotella sp.]
MLTKCFYVVFITSCPSFVCLSASCLSYSFVVVHYAFKNKIGNVLNNTQNLNGSNDRFGFNAAFSSAGNFSRSCARMNVRTR